ncbi:MAG: hypothetical protein UU25_C0037G0004 [Microgenomates group bacterium GW2011_GWB1_40_9]|uniref:Histidine kinase N-terminal 7TM region domain-containing protein n=1 Tax=Candidatus Zambryskibacteria bacterium RIFCSPHIGHO2_01_FULL_46_30 TaxID=1802739 RepID=A0A1G2T2I9_9BACT|nr:MAG: hypothetical protein UU25_C0037G0004 [Microgenomates group bacterium GW2011_GWB1_40_9]OHA91464.1 MAG: hypothetical protein A2665_00855 [Candidatus Zambryskibacteria bacterium RIFCSPHIGHO2_01_FULL_46_30]
MEGNSSRNVVSYIIPTVIFIFYSFTWLYIQQFEVSASRDIRQLWGHTYLILSVFGGIAGLFISKKWGGYKSLLGKAIAVLSIGLLFQSFGQIYSSYYVYFYDVESPPYPAIGDIGFFGSVLVYIYGVLLLSRLSGVHFSMRKFQNKIWMFTVPIFMLGLSYFLFLKGYELTGISKVQVFLDFGYPLGQALYVSIAILSLIISWNWLGGVLQKPIWFLIFALIFQSLSDFTFIFQAISGTWYVGGVNDFMYLTSYYLMAMALIHMGSVFKKIKES